MSLTVDGLYKMFSTITFDDVKDILGSANFDDNTVVKPDDVAQYNGKYFSPLSIFYAKNETEEFLPLLDETKRKRVASNAGIKETDNNKSENGGQKPVLAYIPMNTSVFDIAKQNKMAA